MGGTSKDISFNQINFHAQMVSRRMIGMKKPRRPKRKDKRRKRSLRQTMVLSFLRKETNVLHQERT
jgi:hypothetical protein